MKNKTIFGLIALLVPLTMLGEAPWRGFRNPQDNFDLHRLDRDGSNTGVGSASGGSSGGGAGGGGSGGAGGGVAASTLLDDLEAYWAYSAGAETTDTAGGAFDHSGTDSVYAVTRAGKIGKGWGVDTGIGPGAGATHMDFYPIDPTPAWSISAWVKGPDPLGFTDTYGLVIGQDGNNALFFTNAKLNLYVGALGGGHLAASDCLVAGTWVHVAVVADGALVTYYCNGVADANTYAFAPELTLVTSGGHSIGETIGGSFAVNEFNGMIDEVAVWTRALTLLEIASLYNSGAGVTHPFTGSP